METEDVDSFYPSWLNSGLAPDHFAGTDDERTNLVPTRRVDVGIDIRNLLSDRVLRVTAISIDTHGLRVQYNVTPPLDPIDLRDNEAEGDWLQYEWYLAGRDDLGNHYDTGGGAQGLAADGQNTEGVHTLTPVPAANSSWLDVAFCTGDAGEQLELARYVLRVHFPLVVDTPAEMS